MSGEPNSETVRRVVTGHDESGRSVLAADEEVVGRPLAEDSDRADAVFFHLWATKEMPVDLSDEAAECQREGSLTTIIGSGAGSVLRIGALGPGLRSPMHRTQSLDYGICLSGECDLELDSGERVTIRPGDVIIQRGTKHVWHNRGTTTCRIAWILLDALPVEVAGRELSSGWEHGED